MADVKEYGYFLKGNKLAIVEKDTAFDNDVNSKDYGPGSNRAQWKSPLAAVADGLEIEYTYVPSYWINDVSDTQAITGYEEDSNGFLKVTGSGMSTDAAVDYIVIRGSNKLSGLHKVTTRNASYWILATKYNGDAVTESMTAYQDIDVLNDESDELHIRPYQVKALECYVRAKLAMDVGNIELHEYYMKEFRKKLEKEESGKIWGARMTAVGPHGIR
tara:strand:+ start:10754 stop:11404 length:651 start_codon:yes stop_codon:yes gene_type:complete